MEHALSDLEKARLDAEDILPPALVIATSGVVTLTGYGSRINVSYNHLIVYSGRGDGEEWTASVSRIAGLKRLVMVGRRGLVSLQALGWLHDTGAEFVVLDHADSMLAWSGQIGRSLPHLRRAQAIAPWTAAGYEVTRWLLTEKIQRQGELLRTLDNDAALDVLRISRVVSEAVQGDFEPLRKLEAEGAARYWQVIQAVPVHFQNKVKIPAHWRSFGDRYSVVSGKPNSAVSPGHAMLNYLYAILRSEVQSACVLVGLDPQLGVLHSDLPNRASLALDLMEPLRPLVDRWLLDFVAGQGFDQKAFIEYADGRVAISSALKKELSGTALLWKREALPLIEKVAQMFLDSPLQIDKGNTPAVKATKLQPVKVSRIDRPVQVEKTRACKVCGAATRFRRTTCSREHANQLRSDSLLTANARARMAELRAQGRDPSTTPEVLDKRSLLSTRNRLAELGWVDDGGDYSDQAWLELYPKLQHVRVDEIVAACGVSKSWVSLIRNGKRKPHPRHWASLIQLAEQP
jgi:CRISPR-associated endonuclease Cas1